MRHRHTTQNQTQNNKEWWKRVQGNEQIRTLPNMRDKRQQSQQGKDSNTHQPTRLINFFILLLLFLGEIKYVKH